MYTSLELLTIKKELTILRIDNLIEVGRQSLTSKKFNGFRDISPYTDKEVSYQIDNLISNKFF